MKKYWIAWTLSLLFTIVCVLVNKFQWQVPSMLPLEFAHSADQMKTAIDKIPAADKYHVLMMNTRWDYGFLIGYSLTALFSFFIFFDVFQLKVRMWVYLLAFITGILDALENAYLYATAVRQQEQFSYFYYWVVRIKWALAIIPALMILMIIGYGLILLLRKRA